MKTRALPAALLLATLSPLQALAASAINLYECSGGAGVYGYESTPVPIPAFRSGIDPWTVRGIADVDSLTPGQDGVLWATHRQDNDSLGHAVVFNDSGNNLEYQYNATAQFSVGSIAANTPFGFSISSDGAGGNITIRLAAVSSPSTSVSNTGVSGGSEYSDGQAAEMMFCGYESGGTVFMMLDGQAGYFEILRGVAETEAAFEAWLADPRNVGDIDMDQNGTNAYWWEDAGSDLGGNAVGMLTLATMSLGTGNGPTLPDRSSPPPPSGSLTLIRRRQ
jgi:hypothetical protein